MLTVALLLLAITAAHTGNDSETRDNGNAGASRPAQPMMVVPVLGIRG
jgi:hypothetical protein